MMDAREKIRSRFADHIDEMTGGRIPYTRAIRLLESYERQITNPDKRSDNKCSSM